MLGSDVMTNVFTLYQMFVFCDMHKIITRGAADGVIFSTSASVMSSATMIEQFTGPFAILIQDHVHTDEP